MHALLTLVLAASIHPPNGAAYRQPQLASGEGQVVLTFGAEKSIYFSASPDQRQDVLQTRQDRRSRGARPGRHRGPRATILKNAILVSAVIGAKVATGEHAHGLPEAGDLTVWRSLDRGKTWSKYPSSTTPPAPPAKGSTLSRRMPRQPHRHVAGLAHEQDPNLRIPLYRRWPHVVEKHPDLRFAQRLHLRVLRAFGGHQRRANLDHVPQCAQRLSRYVHLEPEGPASEVRHRNVEDQRMSHGRRRHGPRSRSPGRSMASRQRRLPGTLRQARSKTRLWPRHRHRERSQGSLRSLDRRARPGNP